MPLPAHLQVLPVRFGDGPSARDHEVVIGLPGLPRVGEFLRAAVPGAHRVHCVADTSVDALYGITLRRSLHDAGLDYSTSLLPPGEPTKTLATAAGIFDDLVDQRLERQDVIVSLGGGVTTDLAGFVAATYLRGVAVVHVPTTLLAQVDAALGGKTGVNLPRGKNLVGAFHQPRAVLCDVGVLASLPVREFRSGLAEVVKCAVIADAEFFAEIERQAVHGAEALQRDTAWLAQAVAKVASIKIAIVTRDEREAGERALLNFGHTVGHALEAVTGYATFLHGEAVAIGMIAACHLSEATGEAPAGTVERVERLVRQLGLPVVAGRLEVAAVLDKLQYDKKMKDGKARFVLTRGVGSATVAADLPDEIVASCVTAILR